MKINTLLLFIVLFILSQCASVQPPPGGPRDEKEPELLTTIPVNGSKNFKGKSIQFVFDEYVQLDNIYKQLLITPITEELKYESRVKKNRVILNFENDFLDSTTYTINLRDAVVDVTEKNIAKNVKIAFSTGDFIDSLSVGGNVADLYSGLPPEEAVVMLFRPEDTLNIQDPYYLSKTDEFGNYLIENIKVADYQIFALEEEDNNYKYTKDEEEKIGFLTNLIQLDTVIEKLDFKVTTYDNAELEFRRATTRNQYVELSFTKPVQNINLTFEDSSFQDSVFYAIENDIVKLYNIKEVKEEEITEQSTTKEKRKKRKKKKKNNIESEDTEIIPEVDSLIAYIEASDFLDKVIIDTAKFIFERKRVVEPEDLTTSILPQNGSEKINEEIFDIDITFNKPVTKFDSTGIYILQQRDTSLFNLDTLFTIVREDTLIIPTDTTLLKINNIDTSIEWTDTVNLILNKEYIIDNQKVNSNILRQLLPESNRDIAKKSIRINKKDKVNYQFVLQYFDTTQITLDTVYYDDVVIDTVNAELDITPNNLFTNYTISDYSFNPKEQIYIDSTAFISVENDSIESTIIKFKLKNAEDFGTLGGIVNIEEESYFLQVLNDKYEMEQEQYNSKNFKFEYVEAGNKFIRIQIDNNKNGIWEKGSFELKIPPETVYFRKDGGLDLRPNWEILDINLSENDLSTYQQNNPEN